MTFVLFTVRTVLAIATGGSLASADREQTTRHPSRLPIFRELEDFPAKDYAAPAGDEPPSTSKVDPAAYLQLSDVVLWRLDLHRDLVDINRALGKESLELHAQDLARAKLNSVLEPYRTGHAAIVLQKPALRLGATMRPREPLGANINNYAPDEFSDLEVVQMFQVNDCLRQGASLLSERAQKRLNEDLRENFVRAMAGIRSAARVSGPPAPSDDQECAICRERLAVEPALTLPCSHSYHRDCIVPWNRERVREIVHLCPLCREQYRMPFGVPG